MMSSKAINNNNANFNLWSLSHILHSQQSIKVAKLILISKFKTIWIIKILTILMKTKVTIINMILWVKTPKNFKKGRGISSGGGMHYC